jgi:hypothetical protein
MDPVGIIGIILGVIGIGVSYWQYKRAEKAENNLHIVLHRLPSQLLSNVARFLQTPQSDIRGLYDLQESDRRLHTSFADLDGDGEDELLVQHPYGAHAAVLQVFGFRDGDFKLIDEITADTMAGFVAEDKDGDGKLEVVTHEVSRDADFPYVMGFRDEVWYRLENERFVEAKRINLYDSKDLKNARRDHERWLSEDE